MKLSRPTVWVALTIVALLVGSFSRSGAQEQKKPKRRPSPAFAPITDNPALPRVMLIGDSISIGYTLAARKELNGKANVHRPAANCGDTNRGVEELDKWLGDGKWDVIHFNWGLHDLKRPNDPKLHQVPIEQYEKNLSQLVKRMKKTGAKLIWCSTTPVPEGCTPLRAEKDVLAYNAVAKKIMEKNDVAIDDLHAFALERLEQIQRPRNVHFSPEGSAVLAKQVAASIGKALK